jgi:signal transduction histidine kinase/CheY-like chemotaxis protein
VTLLSLLRLLLYRHHAKLPPALAGARRWHLAAVLAAALSGCIWGSAAPLLYPTQRPDYDAFVIVLLTLLPVVPVAALAAYMPAFYAYYFPCILPFVATLAMQPGRSEKMAALLLLMMMGAMVAFARRYARTLSEAIRLRVQLAAQTRALEDAVRHKTQFIAAASHDLRQPVHAMTLFLESLRQQDLRLGTEPFIGHIDASLRNLRSMLTNMLDVSKLDAEVVGPRLHDFDIEPLLRKLADEYAPLAAQKGLDFRCRCRPAAVRSDPALLERILRNLLSNALKYTERGGVALVGRGSGPHLQVQVFDTGIGMSRADLSLVFREFHQLGTRADRSEVSGLGLGLSIVQRMAGLLGHAVQVRSAPGRGSVFTVVLSRSRGMPPPVAIEPAAHTPEMPPGWVVIVDDDEAVGAAAAALLHQWGHHCTVCASAEAVLSALDGAATAPKLLIVDFRLGGGASGLDAVARIRERVGQPVPVILVTGDTAPARIREAYAAGHALLHKPVDPQRLRACMAEACPPA